MAMKKILHLCEKHCLMKPKWNGSEVSSLKFGPFGEFLINNVRQEWLLCNVINREENVFPIHSSGSHPDVLNTDVLETYTHIRNLCNAMLPFGVAQTSSGGSIIPKDIHQVSAPHAVFNPSQRTNLRSLLFVSPNDARQKFYTWQQKRKMWWRKFSSHPGRFSFSDITECNGMTGENTNNLQVNILAEFEWGPTVIETIQLSSMSALGVSEEQIEAFKVKDARKQVSPNIVECIVSLDIAALVFLCDAYFESSKRELLRFHRRLAPIKAGFVINHSDASCLDRLLDVARHLSQTMRQNGLTTFLLPDTAKKSQDTQLSRNDEMGIPFTVVLSDSTLTDGIIHLYSRETTLKEQVHISKLSEYMSLLVKNY